MDSRIGMLSNGKFYAYVNGYDVEPVFTDTLEEIEALLKGEVYIAPVKVKAVKKTIHSYIVTVTPDQVVYAGGSTFGEYSIEVNAPTQAEAIKKARSQRRETEGRYGVKCIFRAKRV